MRPSGDLTGLTRGGPRGWLAMLLMAGLLVSFAPGMPAQAGNPLPALQWAAVSLPETAPGTEVNQVVPAPDGTLWMVDAAAGVLRRNKDAAPGIGLAPYGKLAIAPDDGRLLALVTSDAGWRATLYVSTDSGFTWADSRLTLAPGQVITDVAVSPAYATSNGQARDILAATARPGPAAYGGLWFYQMRSGGFGAGWFEAAAANGLVTHDFYAVAFPAGYAGDFTLVAAAHNNTSGNLELEMAQRNPNTPGAPGLTWNQPFGYPRPIAALAPDAAATATLALPADFTGQDARRRRLWAGFDAGAAGGDVFLIDGAQPARSLNSGGRPYRMAFSGNGARGTLLVAFAAAAPTPDGTASLAFTTNPQGPIAAWSYPDRAPSGGWGAAGEVRAWVEWTADGARAYAGTFHTAPITNLVQWATPGSWAPAANDESAISLSTNGGLTWNQTDYIDTTLSGLYDFAIAADEGTAYLASFNNAAAGPGANGRESLWRSASPQGATGIGVTWERVLCMETATVAGARSAGNQPLVRLAPDGGGTVVFWGDQGGNLIQRSGDRGTSWNSLAPGGINALADFGAVDAGTLLALEANGRLVRGTTSGVSWLWSGEINTQLTIGYSLSVTGQTALAGGDTVSVSQDGGLTWTANRGEWPGLNAGGFVAVPDAGYTSNGYYYVGQAGTAAAPAAGAAGPPVARARFGQSGYEALNTFAAATDQVYPGLISPRAGLLYALRGRSQAPGAGLVAAPGAVRALDATISPPSRVEVSVLANGLTGGEFFRAAPNPLKAGNGSIWAVDGTAGRLLAFIDTLSIPAPTIALPPQQDALNIRVSFNGYGQPTALRWNLVSPDVRGWDIQIGLDPGFSALLVNVAGYIPPNPALPAFLINSGPGVLQVPLMAGTDYWTRVRAALLDSGQAITSAWSDPVKISISPGAPVVAPSAGSRALDPPVGAALSRSQGIPFTWTPVAGTTLYRFVLADNPALQAPLADVSLRLPAYQYAGKLEDGRTYFWQVQALEPARSDPSSIFTFSVRLPATPAPIPTPTITVPPPVVNVVPPGATTPAPTLAPSPAPNGRTSPPARTPSPAPDGSTPIPTPVTAGFPGWAWVAAGLGAFMLMSFLIAGTAAIVILVVLEPGQGPKPPAGGPPAGV